MMRMLDWAFFDFDWAIYFRILMGCVSTQVVHIGYYHMHPIMLRTTSLQKILAMHAG